MTGKRLDEVEKLARDICWTGFSRKQRIGRTKAEYWRDINWASRDDYMADAKHLLHLIYRLGLDRIAAAYAATRKDGILRR